MSSALTKKRKWIEPIICKIHNDKINRRKVEIFKAPLSSVLVLFIVTLFIALSFMPFRAITENDIDNIKNTTDKNKISRKNDIDC
jgi:hypothetical protein